MRYQASNWVRHARHRAKKYGVTDSLTLDELISLIDVYDSKCAYTGGTANTFDHIFPLADGSPNVVANCLPCSNELKQLKGSHDLVWLFEKGSIDSGTYERILKEALGRDTTGALKSFLKLRLGR